MTKRELVDYCLTYPSAFEDYPFHKTSAILKYGGSKKMFSLIGEREGTVCINPECEPIMRTSFFRLLGTVNDPLEACCVYGAYLDANIS